MKNTKEKKRPSKAAPNQNKKIIQQGYSLRLREQERQG
jgi:hypothetical protein